MLDLDHSEGVLTKSDRKRFIPFDQDIQPSSISSVFSHEPMATPCGSPTPSLGRKAPPKSAPLDLLPPSHDVTIKVHMPNSNGQFYMVKIVDAVDIKVREFLSLTLDQFAVMETWKSHEI